MGISQNWEFPPTSIIVASRNRPGLLFETVESILEADALPAELVIVDQSDSPQESLAIASGRGACRIRYLWSQSRGKSRAQNMGIALASHPILVFTDDDIRVAPTWLRSILGALLSAGPKSVVTGRVLPEEPMKPGAFVPSCKTDLNPMIYRGRIGQDPLFGNNMAMWSSAFEQAGTLDERLGPGTVFHAAEDNDLGFRLLEAGYQIIYVPEAVVYHRAWRLESDYLALRWAYARGQGAFLAKHLSLRDPYIVGRMLKTIKNHCWGFLRCLRRQRLIAYGNAIYLCGFFSGAAEWLVTQRSMR